MSGHLKNNHADTYEQGQSNREEEAPFRFLDLSGDHLGVRIEEIPAGGGTSHHHYHTAEEEHVLLLTGSATLHLGEEQVALSEGDHFWFRAGEKVPHHIQNTSDSPMKVLVVGERKTDDVVIYPRTSTVLVKSSAGFDVFTYRDRDNQEE